LSTLIRADFVASQDFGMLSTGELRIRFLRCFRTTPKKIPTTIATKATALAAQTTIPIGCDTKATNDLIKKA
jgi:hypothetical protein